MRGRIVAIHKHDAWAGESRDFLGAVGEVLEYSKTVGLPSWSYLKMILDEGQPCSQHAMTDNSCVFYAVRFEQIQEKDNGNA